MIPKGLFLPIALFIPAGLLATIPGWIYFYGHAQQIAWVLSFIQVVLGLGVLGYLVRGFKLHWILVGEELLKGKSFSKANLFLFLSINLFVLLPGVLIYLVVCSSLAVGHFTKGFVALRPNGFTVQVRKYVRDDGKSVLLVPMAHIGEPEFYRELSRSFPTNSTILMEGVTDDRTLLTNRITYKRMATSLGLSQQQKEFKPNPMQMVPADIDVEEFAPSTLDFLNAVMLLQAKGITVENLLQLMRYTGPPGFEEQLFADLLTKRNGHLLEEIKRWLQQSDSLIVPWGAAHMVGLEPEIKKSGFRLASTREYTAISFGHRRHQRHERERPNPPANDRVPSDESDR
jgi:hypothetical protein